MSMKTAGFLLMFFVLLPASVHADDWLVRLSLLEGDVQVLIQDTTDWTAATINLPLNEQDRLWIPAGGRAELQIQGGVYLRSEGDSSVDILTLNRDSAQFYLDRGRLYINNRRGGTNVVQVDTPLASIRSYDNSVLMIDLSDDGIHEISVLKGEIRAESRAGATSVNAGNTLTIRGERNAEISPISRPDDWERWNIDRDREVTAWSESARYLPDELQEYSSDFDRYGRWHYSGDYGYVWSPVATGPNWAPYSVGSWIWIRGNYVWVDYDPWGWAPSHYGRWVFISARGWCWVPPAMGGVYWGPGYVGWIVTPSYVAWVPLAPGEIYYGYGYYGHASVNIASININTTVVNRTYRNAGIRNSVVVVDRNSFGTGRRVPVRVTENPFHARTRHNNVKIVPPRVRPDRPVVVAPPEARQHTKQVLRQHEQRRAAPERRIVGTGERQRTEPGQGSVRSPRAVLPAEPGQQPPERIRRNRPQDLKKERPVVRQPDASVFQKKPDTLSVTRSSQPREFNRKQEQKQQPGAPGRAAQQRHPQKRQGQR